MRIRPRPSRACATAVAVFQIAKTWFQGAEKQAETRTKRTFFLPNVWTAFTVDIIVVFLRAEKTGIPKTEAVSTRVPQYEKIERE
jgi:hypothetical protein